MSRARLPVAAIIRRLDAALEAMNERGMKPRALRLTQADYEALAKARTKRYRQETGSAAFLWPCSYGDVPLVNSGAVAKMVPVVENYLANGSFIISERGVAVSIPRRALK